ncbi:acyl-CoA thioesterase [Rhodococcus sp. NPDC019627]|uniref:acyl-CoA thioesterase n=1 Tax=unclassified Rhodococcus (in: high G+C Gram-positive bacteria) TaxID=192944 RepID=UPI0034001CEE
MTLHQTNTPTPIYTTGSLVELLELEKIEQDVFRASAVYFDPYPLYGGQVAAQALRAAGLTVCGGRLPHSLHGYFLRPGDASRPIVYQVFRERDGRSFSARRVLALQGEKAIFSMSTSFHVVEDGPQAQVLAMPTVPLPDDSAPYRFPRLFSFEGRRVDQRFPHDELLTRFWARCTENLGGDPLLNACALTYLSDDSSGVAPLDTDSHRSWASLDHTVWFHQPVAVDEWMLVDLVPRRVGKGRGWYTGSLYLADGTLAASLAQETLYRPGSDPYFEHYR